MRPLRGFGWGMPLLVGAALRLLAALSGHGWFAVDDYQFGVEQGAAWLDDPGAPFPCDYRSPLMSRMLWALMWAGRAAGLADRAHVLQAAYLGLGVWSLAAIPGIHALARPRLGAAAARAAAWLMAAYAILPRISTRALIEVIAIVPLVWACVCLDRALLPAPGAAPDAPAGGRRAAGRGLLLGAGCGLLLGAATLLRFQLGVLFAAAALSLGWGAAAAVAAARRGAAVAIGAAGLGLALGGLAGAGAQAALDVALGRPPLSTPWHYLRFNLAHSASFGTSPWYTFVLQFVLLSLPPVTLLLLVPFGRALRRHWVVALWLGLFVLSHSLVGHKEDRFMFPALPLFFVPVGAALVAMGQGRAWPRLGARLFWGLNAVALVAATLSDAHRNLTVPLLALARQQRPLSVAAVGFAQLPTYYAGRQASVRPLPDLPALGGALEAGLRPDYVLLRHPPTAAELQRLHALPGLRCAAPVTYPGDWVDRLLVRVNRHNARRGATAMLACGVGDPAG